MFRNLEIYRVNAGWKPQLAEFSETLAGNGFAPCAPTQEKSGGWVPPRGEEHAPLVENVNGHWLMRYMFESRMLPASAVRDRARERAAQIEATTGRRPGKKEMRDLGDEARLDLLPRAFTRQTATAVWLDRNAGLLMVGTTTQARSDEITTALTNVSQGLSLALPDTATSPQAAMAQWLAEQEPPAGFSLGRECELRAADESRSVVRYARHRLELEEIQRHIAQGKLPVKLALNWGERASFVLNERLQILRLAFEDIVFENLAGDDRNFDADAIIATHEIAHMIQALITALGGFSRG